MNRKSVYIILSLILGSLGLHAQETEVLNQTMGSEEEKPTVYMVANAHLDTQWRWDIRQTINEFLLNTVLQNFRLIEEYPEYIFNFEGAVKYMWVKEYYPELYGKLKEYIQQGRWFPAGSSWDANDPNLPSTEATIRNILYGQHFYMKEFGMKGTDIMLPDCFGFGYTLPTVASHCGLTAFGTQKLQWRARPFYEDGRRFPFLFGIWEGIDGSRLMASLDGGNYSWCPTNEDLTDFADFKDRLAKNPIPAAYRYFGTRSSRLHDDQGGSPTPEGVRLVDQAIKNPKSYQLKFATVDQMFKDYYMDERLPVFNGELLMDIHATGCYTSHSEMKKINRKNEWMLLSSEGAGAIAHWLGAMPYEHYTIDESWKRVILHQFHDDLTGTSLPSAYQFSYNDEYVVANQLSNLVKAEVAAAGKILDTRVSGTPVVVYNAITARNNDVVKVVVNLPAKYDGVAVYAPSGKKVNSQIIAREGDMATVAFAADSQSMGIAVYDVRPVKKAEAASVLKADRNGMENRIYKLRFDENGDICSLVDKRNGREMVKDGDAFGLIMFENNESNVWPAWEILKPVLDRTPARIKEDVKITVEELGALRAVVRIEKKYGESTFVQRVIMTDGANDDRIDIENDVDWKHRSALLKYNVPMNLSNDEASYDLGLGNIRRGVSTDLKYEVYAHQWADLTDADGSYGVTVMNDSKYGWDHPDKNTLRLTLLHTPTARAYDVWQQTMDLGKHSFTFSICGHQDKLDPVKADIVSDCLNQPSFAYVTTKHKGEAGKEFSMVKGSSDAVRVKAFKAAQDGNGIIVRTYELTGNGTEGEICFAGDILSAEEVNGIEETIGAATFSGNRLKVKAGGFEPKSYRVVLKESQMNVPAEDYTKIDLPYNAVAISSDAFSAFGHMDNEWHSYAAEILPEDLTFTGVPFKIAEADYNNAVRCHGQKIQIPAGASKIYLLAASSEGTRTARFDAGKAVDLEVGYFTDFYGYYGWEGYYEGVKNNGNVAYMGTHRHDSRKRNETYEYTYMYILEVPVAEGATELLLPNDDKVVVFAATSMN